MRQENYNLKIITPCFCAGADQKRAEVRASSIRGCLRWWFRVLGGNNEQEQAVFGGIAGEKGKGSAIIVRVSNFQRGEAIELPSMRQQTPLSYLLYYANASGRERQETFGPRFSKTGYLPPGSTFTMSVLYKRYIGSREKDLLSSAVQAFIRLGTLGYRGTRGCGAILSTDELFDFNEFTAWSKKLSNVEVSWLVEKNGGEPVFCYDWNSVLCMEEEILKAFRNQYPAGKRGDRLSPLGMAGNRRENIDRQASAVRLRPVKLKEGLLPAVVYTERALDSRMGQLQIQNYPVGRYRLA